MITFTVDGDPQTKGSAKAFKHATTGRVIVMNDNPKCKAWASAVGWKARLAMGATPIAVGPVRVEALFTMPRPRTSKLAAPRLDVDKLIRALLDALTGIVYRDDAQVVEVVARKMWGKAGVRVTVTNEPKEQL